MNKILKAQIWLWCLALVQADAQTPAPTFSVVRHLPEWSNPTNPLTLGSDGHFYGSVINNESRPAIFRMTPGGAYTTLHSFSASGSWSPSSALVEGLDGHFYGSSDWGGIDNNGTVYRLTRAGKVSVIHRFTDAEGKFPGTLIRGSDGHLYGEIVRFANGVNFGVVFKLTTAGKLTTLAIFPNEFPGALTEGQDGNVYGTTFSQTTKSGWFFRVTPTGVLTKMAPIERDERPSMILGSDGAFYGTTFTGGLGSGSVFKATLAGEITTLVNFDGFNGAGPCGGLCEGSDGLLYGTTVFGQTLDTDTGKRVNINGTVFSLTKAGVLTTLVRFPASDVNNHAPSGAMPQNGVTIDATGALWGAAAAGGLYRGGVLFRYGPPLPDLPLPTLRIVTQPVGVNARTGDTVRFKVVAQGSGKTALAYQWLKNGKAIGNSSLVSGARTNTLTLRKVGMVAGGSYSVVVSEGSLRVTSAAALLRVTFADDDKDGVSNDLDRYPKTATGDVVNKSGGSIAQLVPMSGPWKSFNQYLGALVKTVNAFRKAGLITAKEGSLIILKAIASKSKVKIKG